MERLSFVLLLTFFLAVNGSGRGQDGSEFFSSLEKIIQTPSLMSTVACANPTRADFELQLFTRDNPMDPVPLNMKNPELDPTKPIIVIIHGWAQSPTAYGMQDMKKAYLYRYDSNVIMVNWQDLAWDYYPTAVCKVPKLAKMIADFLCTLSEIYDIDLETVHFVGHSLGAHMSGVAGYHTQNMCRQKIGRITGLDPAGPLFVDTERPNRLDSSDASFVDVIHTNGGFLGYLGNCGHADFYINCGSIQVGCTMPDYSLNSFMNLPMSIGMCHHMRSIDIWTEAVQTDNFKAIPCYYCPIGCPPVFSMFKTRTMMGERCPRNASGGYYVKTDVKKPYALTSLI
ncbi:phospholipase A1-like [Photinus pyralis]|uniref:phospholipase A1-like n=1 Tax=Photinus pyralis TaxID=7054 RepID=UPI00126750C2|nr:phospholipase A1-like [Photinus pyralis]